ncbi:hypothetical protein [Amycolatopsis sp. NPDC059657]|uniref:hypothetical protein n=1 Tax=Amycolatopsis sp. NPDC059657 TaxID=3346899 RepID=UPI00366E7B55
MDPTAVLAEIRDLITDHRMSRPLDETRLAELGQGFAEWLRKGGFPPRQWTHPADYSAHTAELHSGVAAVVLNPASAVAEIQFLCSQAKLSVTDLVKMLAGLDRVAVLRPGHMPARWITAPAPAE